MKITFARGVGLMGIVVLMLVAAAPNIPISYELPLGHQVLTNPNATALTMPVGTRHVKISVRSGGVMYEDDGTSPTSTNGFYIPANTLMVEYNDPQIISAMKFTCSTDNGGACTVYAKFDGNR